MKLSSINASIFAVCDLQGIGLELRQYLLIESDKFHIDDTCQIVVDITVASGTLQIDIFFMKTLQ
ncbi:hypothetical protein [Ewingella americana]|uniref:Uncharacterized protein n=1 Tax=Ewingella americana TaxID=41202 RepID=A0A502GFN8_9GAMM|nr:hypothetical protein [Ewingella americana]TPG60110.1 hypothetical protein EAH77_16205 [Ewingella americana]